MPHPPPPLIYHYRVSLILKLFNHARSPFKTSLLRHIYRILIILALKGEKRARASLPQASYPFLRGTNETEKKLYQVFGGGFRPSTAGGIYNYGLR
jgi:hypothetical protein